MLVERWRMGIGGIEMAEDIVRDVTDSVTGMTEVVQLREAEAVVEALNGLAHATDLEFVEAPPVIHRLPPTCVTVQNIVNRVEEDE
jgi:hypothetical protein